MRLGNTTTGCQQKGIGWERDIGRGTGRPVGGRGSPDREGVQALQIGGQVDVSLQQSLNLVCGEPPPGFRGGDIGRLGVKEETDDAGGGETTFQFLNDAVVVNAERCS